MVKTIKLENNRQAQLLFGPADENLKAIRDAFKIDLVLGDGYIKLKGSSSELKKTTLLINRLLSIIRSEKEFNRLDLHTLIREIKEGKRQAGLTTSALVSAKPKIAPKTKGQEVYLEAIKKYDIVFGIGPAGTGKTYLAMAAAVEALKNQKVRRIILTRPAIEAGESLGFLPGDMYEKISPYLRPLYDAIYDMMEAERIERFLETGIIEIAPLAYMRGRTLNDAFIILDEAQNATAEQMKMFLTRLGFESKAVITGDITQSDLPGGKPLGLLQAQEILKGIEGIKFIYFSGQDVVRHELVQKIIASYDKAERGK